MELDFKSMVVIVLIVVGLFAGGLYYIYQENQRHQLAYSYLQEYLQSTSPRDQAIIEAKVRELIDRPPLIQTSSASLDSWEQVRDAALLCDDKAKGMAQLDPTTTYGDNWRECMDDTLTVK